MLSTCSDWANGGCLWIVAMWGVWSLWCSAQAKLSECLNVRDLSEILVALHKEAVIPWHPMVLTKVETITCVYWVFFVSA